MSVSPKKHRIITWLTIVAMLLTVAPVPAGAVQDYYQYADQWGDRQADPGKLYAPTAVVVDNANNVYVLDSGNDRVQKFDAAGNFITKWGTTGSGNLQFKNPKGMTIDGSNNIYVADTGNDRVLKFSSSGTYLAQFSSYLTNTLTGPQGVAYDGGYIYVVNGDDSIFKLNGSLVYQTKAGSSGGPGLDVDNWRQFRSASQVYANGSSVYVADTLNNRVQKLTSALASGSPAGWYATDPTNTSWANAPFSDDLGSPMGIAARGGIVWVVDTNNSRILKFDSSGVYQGIATGSPGTGNSEFSGPTGVFIDGAQNVYVADTYNNRVQKFDSNGAYLAQFGTGLGTNENNFSAKGVAASSDGNIYVTSTSRNRVEKFDADGTLLGLWGTGGSEPAEFDAPSGVAVDGTNVVYVADTRNHRIQKFNADGIPQGAPWGGYGTGDKQFKDPEGVAVGPGNYVYVADTANHRVQKFSSNGNYVTQWGSQGDGQDQFSYPKDIAVDGAGNVYVADQLNARVQKFNSSGDFLAQIGGPGTGDGQFTRPYAVAIAAGDRLIVADGFANRLQEFDSSGNFITKWASSGSGNGQLNRPSGVAVGSSGKVFVADTDNRRVQRFDPIGDTTPPTGTVSVAGGATYSTTAGVALALSASDYSGVTHMRFAESLGALSATAYKPYATSDAITLTGGDGPKTVYAQFRDGSSSQNESLVVSDGIILDTSSPLPVASVSDEGDLTNSTTTLRADWPATSDPHSGVAAYEYSIGTTPGGINTRGWEDIGTALTVTATGLTLVDTQTYYINVRAQNGAGLYSSPMPSDGIEVNTSVPAAPTVTDDGSFTTSLSTLHATWSSVSGAAEYKYAIGTSPGATDTTVGWISTGAATAVTKSALTLSDGQTYYFSVKAKNELGTWGAAGFSNGITVDASKPSTPGNFSAPAYSTDVSKTNMIPLSWTASSDGSGSGVASYEVQYQDMTTSKPVFKVWRSGLTGTSVDFPGRPGKTYRFRGRATDNAGNVSSVSSYKITRVPYDDRSATPQVGFRGLYSNTASNYYLGTLRYTRRAGEKISFTAYTKRFVLIGTAGNRSRAKIYIDGRFVKEIDPRYTKGYAYRRRLFNYRWSSVGRHTITVENLATRGRAQFDVDGFAAER